MRTLALLAFLACISTLQAAKIVLVAGGGSKTSGPATECAVRAPFGTVSDAKGNLLIVEYAPGERVLRIDPNQNLEVIAGTGAKGNSGDGGPALAATFNSMHSLVLGPKDEIFIADSFNSRIRKIEPGTGNVVAFAGTGTRGFSGDRGPALKADFGNIYCVATDAKREQLYLADLDNRRIRAIDLKTGIVRTVAGDGTKGVPKDGSIATEAPLVDPRAVAADSKGNIYVLERSGNTLRVVDSAGKIQTVVGTGEKGMAGDGGPALQATMNGPKHLWVDRNDNVLIADTENHLIRKYIPATKTIERVAGNGKRGTGGLGGSPTEAELNQPHGVYEDPKGIIYISDSTNNRVLKIVP